MFIFGIAFGFTDTVAVSFMALRTRLKNQAADGDEKGNNQIFHKTPLVLKT